MRYKTKIFIQYGKLKILFLLDTFTQNVGKYAKESIKLFWPRKDDS